MKNNISAKLVFGLVCGGLAIASTVLMVIGFFRRSKKDEK